MYTIEIQRWINGSPVTVRTVQVDETEESRAVQCLRNIGYYHDYDGSYAGYLLKDGAIIAILNIVGTPNTGTYRYWITTIK